MRVELMIEGQEDVTWPQWVALAQACEQHGVGTLFRSDHYLSVEGHDERGSLETWTTLAGLAAVTTRLRLGVLVSPATFRHPSVLAKTVTAVDHISGGRVELGLGAGWNEPEHEAYGFEFPPLGERMEMLEEQLAIVRGAWADGPFSFDGQALPAGAPSTPCPKPVQRPHPPLIIGGGAKPRTARMAAQFADEYNTVYATPAECAERRAVVRAGLGGRGPRPGDADVLGHGAVADRAPTPADLAQRAERLAAWQGSDAAALIEEFAAGGRRRDARRGDRAPARLPRRGRRPDHAAAPAARRSRRHRAARTSRRRRRLGVRRRRPREAPRHRRGVLAPDRHVTAPEAARRLGVDAVGLHHAAERLVQPSSISSVGSGWNWMPQAFDPTRKACTAPGEPASATAPGGSSKP